MHFSKTLYRTLYKTRQIPECRYRSQGLRGGYVDAEAVRPTGAPVPDIVDVAIHCDTVAMSLPLSR